MPENVFRLAVVGLLFILLSYQSGMLPIKLLNYVLGSAFVICAFVAWIDERKRKQETQ